MFTTLPNRASLQSTVEAHQTGNKADLMADSGRIPVNARCQQHIAMTLPGVGKTARGFVCPGEYWKERDMQAYTYKRLFFVGAERDKKKYARGVYRMPGGQPQRFVFSRQGRGRRRVVTNSTESAIYMQGRWESAFAAAYEHQWLYSLLGNLDFLYFDTFLLPKPKIFHDIALMAGLLNEQHRRIPVSMTAQIYRKSKKWVLPSAEKVEEYRVSFEKNVNRALEHRGEHWWRCVLPLCEPYTLTGASKMCILLGFFVRTF
jgi:hypothetical protein